MKSLRNKNLGKLGEELATNYLKSLKFTIIERNFHRRYSEIDIVAKEGETLVFVEVKTRIGNIYGLPEESITPWKLHSLIRSANYYLLLYPHSKLAKRIDVVTVLFSSEERVEKVNHYRNVTGW